MAGLWLQCPAAGLVASSFAASEKDGARRVDSIAFTLEWEKGCASPPALLKEAANTEKSI
jgi:hypothetical protein